ncbi:hypothetical protein [Pseudomonas sp. Irchel 3H7]|uniref:hypothetical protein n=1 Tax=Pseudomonas sp. Irchel 3H7 TaxID=2009042 RepID=UPI000BA386EA|nr:hypothetical protein [Pseudomonas sp. Irchel 3H7]
MKTYSYRPFYQGPSPVNPMRDELSADEQEQKLEMFYADVAAHFENLGSIVKRNSAGLISITTEVPEKDCHKIVANLLISLDLHADKI